MAISNFELEALTNIFYESETAEEFKRKAKDLLGVQTPALTRFGSNCNYLSIEGQICNKCNKLHTGDFFNA